MPNRPKGMSTKPASVVSLNSIRVTKSWIARMKKASSTITQANSSTMIWMKFSKKRDVAHQPGNRIEQRPAGVEPDLGDAAGAQEVGGRETGAGGFQAEPGKALEDDTGKVVPVADEIGEDADEERLLHQPREDVLIAAPRPEQGCQRNVDRDQRGGDEGRLRLSSPKPLSIYWVKTPRKRSMTPVPPMVHSLSDGEIDGHPCGRRLSSFRGPGAGKRMFGTLSFGNPVGVGICFVRGIGGVAPPRYAGTPQGHPFALMSPSGIARARQPAGLPPEPKATPRFGLRHRAA